MYLENYKAIYISIPGINTSRILQCFGGASYASHLKTLSPHAMINVWGYDIWKDSYKFTFVKNPWSRMLEIYQTKKRKFSRFPTFNIWLKNNLNKHNILPQIAYFTDTNFDLFVDYVGKVENFSNDINEIYKHVDRPSIAVLTNIDKIATHLSNNSYRAYYSKDNINAVKKQFSKEIEMFEYEF